MENLSTIATLVITSGAISLLCLFILHFVNPDFKASWRMVSEYALGKHKWLLTSFFILWSINTLLASYLYFNIVSTKWAAFGTILVFISGIGAFMGGLFDIKHKLHGLSFALGVPIFPIGALIIAYHLSNQNNWLSHKNELLISAHSVWVSLVLMGVSMGLFFSGLKKAGIPFGANQEPLTKIPKNVIALNGYANRLLVLTYIGFNIIVSLIFLNL
jgi:hypothetical membrane protein